MRKSEALMALAQRYRQVADCNLMADWVRKDSATAQRACLRQRQEELRREAADAEVESAEEAYRNNPTEQTWLAFCDAMDRAISTRGEL